MENNLSLNVNKTKEMIVDFRKQQREHPPIHIDGTVVEKVGSFKFLGVHITHCNLRRLKKFGFSPKTHHKLLQMHNREHPVRLYHRLVRQLLCPQP